MNKKPSPGECCTDSKCESGLRNSYYSGKRLTADSFRLEQRYHVERRHLLNRAIHGWGVVYGYGVAAVSTSDCYDEGSGRLRVDAGLALDRCGRELLQVGKLTLGLGDLLVVDERGARIELGQNGRPNLAACWLLSVHYAEQHGGPVTVSDPCSCERHEHDHVCETVRYSLTPVDCDDCCRDWPCELECGCGTGHCCDERPVPQAGGPAGYEARASDDHGPGAKGRPGAPPSEKPPENAPKRGGCRCLCDHLIALKVGGECGLCEVEEPCGKVWVDLQNGVPLACVKLAVDDCDRWTFGPEVEPCGPRRLVKRNDLLFDLIRGCDLTRIVEIGWADWHRRDTPPVPFDAFSHALGPDGDDEAEYVTNDFWVRFSRPVCEATLRPDCFAMTVLSTEGEGGWWQPLRVPVVRLEMIRDELADPPGHVRGFKVVLPGDWVEDAARGRRTVFLTGPTRVEIEIRGDFIVDCNGQTVDANAIGLSPSPTGNGKPGDAFLSTFCVGAAREAPRDAYQTEGRRKGASS
jgi:hypothetical protein